MIASLLERSAALQPADHPLVRAVDTLEVLPGWLIHLVLAAGGAVENILPPIPADTFVVVGGVLAGRGTVPLLSVTLLVWGANVAGAWGVFLAGRRWGRRIFTTGPGRLILTERQLERVERFHARHGVAALFAVRLLPGLRAVAPAFAGLAGLSTARALPPIALASALWYGGLAWAGWAAGRNLELLARRLDSLNSLLWALAAVLVGAIGIWWIRSRARSRLGATDADTEKESGDPEGKGDASG